MSLQRGSVGELVPQQQGLNDVAIPAGSAAGVESHEAACSTLAYSLVIHLLCTGWTVKEQLWCPCHGSKPGNGLPDLLPNPAILSFGSKRTDIKSFLLRGWQKCFSLCLGFFLLSVIQSSNFFFFSGNASLNLARRYCISIALWNQLVFDKMSPGFQTVGKYSMKKGNSTFFPFTYLLVSWLTLGIKADDPLAWIPLAHWHLICIKTWASQWFHPYGSQFDLSYEILSAPRITVYFVCELVAPMRCTCDLKITVRCRKYLCNMLYPEPDPARTPRAPTSCWASHFVNLSMESHDSCKFRKKKSLVIWTPLWAFCRSWLHLSDLSPLIWWIRASTS